LITKFFLKRTTVAKLKVRPVKYIKTVTGFVTSPYPCFDLWQLRTIPLLLLHIWFSIWYKSAPISILYWTQSRFPELNFCLHITGNVMFAFLGLKCPTSYARFRTGIWGLVRKFVRKIVVCLDALFSHPTENSIAIWFAANRTEIRRGTCLLFCVYIAIQFRAQLVYIQCLGFWLSFGHQLLISWKLNCKPKREGVHFFHGKNK
jgi:hypothetical protein